MRILAINIRLLLCRYGAVMRALIWRYIVNAHSEHEMEPVTEDDVHELKSDLSSFRCELLDILHSNGMDIGDVDKKEKSEYSCVNTDIFQPLNIKC